MSVTAEAVVRATLPGLTVTETPAAIVFTGDDGPRCELRTTELQDVTAAAGPQVEPRYYEALMAALNDPLAERLLAAGEPDFGTVAGLLPPLLGPSFVGDESAAGRVELDANGVVPGFPEVALPPESLVRAGLLDGWLPAPCHTYRNESATVEQITFATVGARGELVVWRRLRTTSAADGECEQITYERNGAATEPEAFYAALLGLWEHWECFRGAGLKLRLPEPELLDAAQAMLQISVLTFRGLSPRYGVGCYGEERHNSFPPTLIFLVQALLAWGHLKRAGEVLGHYVSRYVRPDGTFDYYGPALAEYGQVLALVAEYVRLSGNDAWLTRRLTLLRPVWERLLALREESRQHFPPDDVHYGLIPGLPEADYHHQADQWQTFYYSGDAWTCRGLREIGRLLAEEGPEPLGQEGAALLAEAEAYERDLRRSLAQAEDREAGYVPPGPDQREPLACLTADRHASYCNYRYLPEMVSAGVLPSATLTAMLRWRREHGGELLGMTRFEERLDDWPALHVARALLEQDEADRYLLLMYAHWAHHSAAGTLASYEQVTIRPADNGREAVIAGQVVPCQVMVPVMLRWGLVYEEREADVLWLCRAVPRRWLAPGQKLSVRGVPTRFGKVGFGVKLGPNGTGEVKLRLPGKPLGAQVKLRLRLPTGRVTAVRLREVPLPLEGDVVSIPSGLAGTQRLQVTWAAG
jgi:hypothetical protein